MQPKTRKTLTVSLLSIPLSAAAALVPVLADLAVIFPDRKGWMQFLITIPSLFLMLSSLVTNKLLQHVSLRGVAGGSIALILFSGISPFWIQSFPYLLLTRALMGIGLGLLNTTVASLPALYFENGKSRDVATGIQAAFISAGGILFSFFSGKVATIQWNYVFLVQIINVLPLLAVLFLMPKTEEKSTAKEPAKIFVKEAVPVTLLSFLCIVMTCTFPLNLSVFVTNSGLGNSATVGTITSINSFIGFILGLTFGFIFSRLKEFTLPSGLLLTATALVVTVFAPSTPVLFLGSTLFGLGSSLISPALYAHLYQDVPSQQVVSAVAMLGIGSNISQFVSPFLINPLARFIGGSNVEASRYLLAAGFIIFISLALIVQGLRKRRVL